MSLLSRWPRLARVLDPIPPASGAVVMGAGIVSVDLYSEHQPVGSAALLWFAAGVWLFLSATVGVRLRYEPCRFAREASSPAALTGVAGTAVLGAGFAEHGYREAAAVLLAVSCLSWAVLLTPVLRRWKTPTAGVSFVLTVATQGPAVLGATLAIGYRARWLLIGALAALIAGLVIYIPTVARFDLRQLVTGRGDQWVAGGALAISALACGKVIGAADALGQFTARRGSLTTALLSLWCLAMVWLAPDGPGHPGSRR